jgi:peptidoglycan/LPS O-acetylase OafA/YrhL
MVVYSHIFQPFFGYNIGGTAVISFLLISGYVMTALIQRYYSSVQLIPNFYQDRFLRLAPQFYFYIFCTVIASVFFGLKHNWMLFPPDFKSILIQLTVFPLNFYRAFPSMLIPQSWSLGLELFFYVIFPFILIFNLRREFFVISLFIFILALAGVIDMDLYGYRYLPGTLFIFICGSYLFSNNKAFPIFIFILSIGFLLLTYTGYLPEVQIEYRRFVLAGLILGIPSIYFINRNSKENSRRSIYGDLSYGVFLNHNLIIGFFTTFLNASINNLIAPYKATFFLIVIVISTLASYLTFNFIEKIFLAYRQKKRLEMIK